MNAYINNYEVACDAGNTAELMDAIYNKNSAITIDTTFLNGKPAGLGIMPKYNDFFEVLEDVVKKILDRSNLDNFHNTLLVLGSSVGGMQISEALFFRDHHYRNIDPLKHSIHVLSDHLMEKFKFYDTRSISTACTSSANALLIAKRLIDVDAYDNVLVVGADAMTYTTVLGFHDLSVLSSDRCRPFDKSRSGMNVSEAIAGLLIQNVKTDHSIELKGVGASSDAYHMTNPDPQGNGAISSMSRAIKDAGLLPEDIDYINAHGTATIANDKVEALAIETLFDKPYVSSTKAITGHTLGAAGAIEAVISCEVLKRSLIAPQTGLLEADNKNINLPTEAITKEVRNVISNSFAFGGNNTSIVMGLC